MATFDIKSMVDKYFQDNWTATPIQFQGFTEPNKVVEDDFISLIYTPVANAIYGMDGTSTGRIEYAGLYRVLCYAKNTTKAFKLADSVKTFLNGKQLGNVYIEIGQDTGVNELGDGFFQTSCSFNVSQWQ